MALPTSIEGRNKIRNSLQFYFTGNSESKGQKMSLQEELDSLEEKDPSTLSKKDKSRMKEIKLALARRRLEIMREEKELEDATNNFFT